MIALPAPSALPLPAPAASDHLRARVRRGSAWTVVGYGASQALRLLNNLILWRLLYPEAFGLMAIVTVCLVGLNMFSDIGIGPSIIQSEHGDDPDYLNTAWTIQVIREIALCAIACVVAAPIAAFYREPQLAQLLPAAALAVVCSGFNSTKLFTAARTISLGRITMIDLVAQVASLVVMIGWAWVSRSIWALIGGNAVYNLVRLILSHTVLPGIRNRFRWDPASARAMLRFGRWIFFSTVLTFIVMQSDRLIFGKLIPMGLLGVYSIATTWASMPGAVIQRIFSTVLFPLLSRIHHEGASIARIMRDTRRPWLLLAGCASACLICGGPALIRLLYEERAEQAGWIIQVLGIGVWLQTLESGNGIALLAQGQSKWLAAGNGAKLVGMALLIPIGFAGFGFPGAVAALAASEVFHYAATAVGVRLRRIGCLGQDLRLTGLLVASCVAGLAVARWIAPALRALELRPAKLGTFLELVLISVSASAAWGLAFLRHRRRHGRPEGRAVAAVAKEVSHG